jgi:hypothetical protein
MTTRVPQSGQNQGNSTLPPSDAEVRPSSPESQPRPLNFWQTIQAIYKQLKVEDDASKQVFKGLALKHGPDLALPAFFAIPVVGWIAGVFAMPVFWWMEKRGQKIIDDQRPNMANNKHKPLYHYLKLQDLVNDPAKIPSKAQSKRGSSANKDTASRMAKTWNRLIDTLFSHEKAEVTPALKRTLRFSLDENKNPNGNMFTRLKRFMEARESLQQKWYYKIFLKPFDWLYKKLPLPKLIKGLALLPKLAILGLFYGLGIKPRR